MARPFMLQCPGSAFGRDTLAFDFRGVRYLLDDHGRVLKSGEFVDLG